LRSGFDLSPRRRGEVKKRARDHDSTKNHRAPV
jgi:hypothetical protein